MNAIELLKKQHRAIDAMFDRLGVPGDALDVPEHEDAVPVEAFQHADGHTETTGEADSRFRDEGGGSAMDASAGEYGAMTQAVDPSDKRLAAMAHPSPRSVNDTAGRRASPASRQHLSESRPFGDDRQALFDQLTSALIAHATVEEQIFYPAARSDQTDDLLYEAIEEHASVRRLIEELRRMQHSDAGFDDKLALLREKVDNHVHDEETELFPNVIEELGAERLMELGRLIDSRYRTLTGSGSVQSRPVSAEAPVTGRPVAR